MAVPVVIMRAFPTLIRAAAKPKVFKRFLGTRAGKRAILKYGTMLVNSKEVRESITKLIKGKKGSERQDQEYDKMLKQYERILKDIEKIESDVAAAGDDVARVQELSFALGRRVVEMRRLYTQMQKHQQRQIQNTNMSSFAHAR